MARSVFFSFHYQNNVVRVNQIRNLPEIVDRAAAGFKDSSLWEEAKKKSDDAVKALIDNGLHGTSVTVVCIGGQTAGRKFINYEIQKSIDRGNGLVGVQIHHLKNFAGETDGVADRLRAHVFLCMLAYHVEWHLRQALAPLLFHDTELNAARAERSSPVVSTEPSPRNPRRRSSAMPMASPSTASTASSTISAP